MKQTEIQKLATELWIRDNNEVFKYMQWTNPTKDELKKTGHWYIAQSRIVLKDMREKRREAKWERY